MNRPFHIFSYIGFNPLLRDEPFPKRYFMYTKNEFLAKEFYKILMAGNAVFQPLNIHASHITYNIKDAFSREDAQEMGIDVLIGRLKWYRSKTNPELQILTTDAIMDELSDNLIDALQQSFYYNHEHFLVCMSYLRDKKIMQACVHACMLLKKYGLCNYDPIKIAQYVDIVSYYSHFSRTNFPLIRTIRSLPHDVR